MLQSKTRSKDLKTQNTQVCILKAVGAISKVNNALLELKNSTDLNTTTLSKYTSTMVPDCTDSLVLPSHVRSSRPEVLVIRNFAKFTGKHLSQSLFFNEKRDSGITETDK